MNQPIIEITNINKEFPSGDEPVRVLKNVSLSIDSGEMCAIIGASGSGKSTLMNILGCLDKPTSGSYKVKGVEIAVLTKDELAELRREYFGFIFQKYHLLSSSSATENVEIPAIYSGSDKETRRTRAQNILTQLGLSDKYANKPNQLSGGQQQRVSIARALMNGGQVILADEPTGALDSVAGAQVMQILLDLNKAGHTIILVTHDSKVASFANRIIEIKDGVIISDKKTVKTNVEESGETEIGELKTAEEEHKILAQVEMGTPKTNKQTKIKLGQFSEAFMMAVKAIYAHKLRSFLTMLGIIIGIASVASVVALGEGSRQKILADISSMGTNTIDIYPGTGSGDRRSASVRTLTNRDADILKQQEYVDSVSPGVNSSGTLIFENIVLSAQIKGVGDQFFQVKGMKMSAGSVFDEADVVNQAQYAVIDNNTKNKVFPREQSSDVIGKVILLNDVPLRVIAVAEEVKSSFGGANESLNIWVPYTTVMSRISGANYLQNITVRIKDSSNTQAAEEGIINILTGQHGNKDFFTINSDSIKETVEKTTATLTLLISAIAVISLVVGGIGVMNIMLVSVTERTGEIGVRMAIGARQSDILQQFLIEAVLICLLGGLAGVGLALFIGFLFNSIATDFSMIYSSASIILALVCSTVIGVVFGFIPARNASELDPIVALSRE